MSVLGWGKCRLFVKDLDDKDAEWIEFPTPVENSTTLETTKGDKQEAKVEGGENEDVRYAKSTYVLNAGIRAAKGRVKPIKDSDGIIDHNYAVAVQPEDPQAIGIYMAKAKPSVEDTWSTEEGGIWNYAFDALKNEDATQVQMGVITLKMNADGKTIDDVTFAEVQ